MRTPSLRRVLDGIVLVAALGLPIVLPLGARAQPVRLGVTIAEGTGPLPGDLALDLSLHNPTAQVQRLPIETCGALAWPSFVTVFIKLPSGRTYRFRGGARTDVQSEHPHAPQPLEPGQTLRHRLALREALQFYPLEDKDAALLRVLPGASGIEVWATVPGAKPSAHLSHRFVLPPVPPPLDKSRAAGCVQKVTVGMGPVCALLSDGTPMCWGPSPPSLIAPEADAPAAATFDPDLATPRPVPLLQRAGVEAGFGGRSLCVRLSNAQVYCVSGGLPVRVLGLREPTRLLLGLSELCALEKDGAVQCWGGSLATEGAGAAYVPTDRLTAISVPALETGVAELAFGASHTCARKQDGALLCWGDNAAGQLGTGDVVAQRRPVGVKLPGPVDSVALGYTHSCAVLRDGAVYCWGKSETGALGRGHGPGLLQSLRPTAVAGLPAAARVFAGYDKTIVQARDGTIHYFGGGVLLDPVLGALRTFKPLHLPELGTDVAEVAIGFRHACARRQDGAVYCWGEHTSELALDPQKARTQGGGPSRPLRVPGLPTDVQELAAGDYFTCARSPGGVYCWGEGASGQLGNGRKERCPRPVRAVLPCH